jgi:hypothetical protein
MKDKLSIYRGAPVQASGAIWAADEAQMWNPEAQAELPSDSDAVLNNEKEMP